MHGGYAVNYYGYHRATDDLGIWIAPTVENKECFLNTLRCMNYTDGEINSISDEDFTSYFMCSLGSPPNVIDVLTIVHKNISFSDAEKSSVRHTVAPGIELRVIPYDFLKDIKLRSSRPKVLFDITRLEELRNKK